MQADKTVYLSKTTTLSNVISKLEGRGVVDVKVATDLNTDTSAIYIKPASIFHPLTRIFSTKKTVRHRLISFAIACGGHSEKISPLTGCCRTCECRLSRRVV